MMTVELHCSSSQHVRVKCDRVRVSRLLNLCPMCTKRTNSFSRCTIAARIFILYRSRHFSAHSGLFETGSGCTYVFLELLRDFWWAGLPQRWFAPSVHNLFVWMFGGILFGFTFRFSFLLGTSVAIGSANPAKNENLRRYVRFKAKFPRRSLGTHPHVGGSYISP